MSLRSSNLGSYSGLETKLGTAEGTESVCQHAVSIRYFSFRFSQCPEIVCKRLSGDPEGRQEQPDAHLVPLQDGPKQKPDNLACACSWCSGLGVEGCFEELEGP